MEPTTTVSENHGSLSQINNDTVYVVLYTGDMEFLNLVWSNYTKALNFLESQVDATGLMNVPTAFQNDWGRVGGAGHNSAMNALLYHASSPILSFVCLTK